MEDFEDQLKQEMLVKDGEKNERKTRKDEDGTEYEWDETKQAWFPKIDEDFIANYQMNYGRTDVIESTGVAEPQREYTEEEVKQYWERYNRYYYPEYSKEGSETKGETDRDTKDMDPDEAYKRYLEYCSYYYGTAESTATATDDKSAEKMEEGKSEKITKSATAKRKADDPPKWFDIGDGKNTNIYVTGLPPDMTEVEFSQLMNKYGLIMHDPRTKKPKIKLYMDEQGQPKGDARCCYIKKESVDLALQLLDGSDIRGHTIHAEVAKFEMKGNFDPKKCKKKLTNKEKKRMKFKQEKLFDWHPDKLKDTRPNHEKVIILKNMFDPEDFKKNPGLITDLRTDIRSECESFGDLRKVVVFDRHEDGVVMVFYHDANAADLCRESLHHRWFSKRRILAIQWDGITKYDVAETQEEKEKRLNEWNKYLEGGGNDTTEGNTPQNNLKQDIETESEGREKENVTESPIDEITKSGEVTGESLEFVCEQTKDICKEMKKEIPVESRVIVEDLDSLDEN